MNTLRDHYAPPGIISDDLQLELEEFMAHYDSHGHWAPQQGCMDPVCIKAGLMVQRAIESFGQQPQQAQ